MPSTKKQTTTGAEALIRCLLSAGIDQAFGIPGGAALTLYDALYAHRDRMRFVLARHEQGATHMADGYARATGRPAAVFVTSGPGATNTVTGIMAAYMDSIPLLVVTGQATRGMLGKDAFQETDVFNLTMPIVKHSYLVKSADDVPRAVREAVYIATSGRPGPVLIDVPQDVAQEPCTAPLEGEVDLPGYHPAVRSYRAEDVATAARWLAAAKRPVLLAGHGAVLSGSADELRRLAEAARAPVAVTLLAKGVMPDSHPLCLGMPGMHGTAWANLALPACDLLLCLGARFDDRILGERGDFCPGARIVHVDLDPSEFGKMTPADLRCQGDVRAFLQDLLPRVARRCDSADWLAEIERNRKRFAPKTAKHGGIRPPLVFDALNRLLAGRKATLVTDVGQHQMWAAQGYRCERPGRFLTSGGGGAMGYGLPAAIGAQLARPRETVVAVVGDGGFQMTMCELATVANQRLPVKILVMENRELGMVRQWQDLLCGGRHSAVALDGNPDFAKLAAAYGIAAWRVKRPADVERTLRRALGTDGPALVVVETARGETVYPMVPPGHPLGDMQVRDPRKRAPGRPRKTPATKA